MRCYLYISVVFLFIGCGRSSEKTDRLSTIRSFKAFSLDSAIFSSEKIPAGYPVILMYFDPNCDHCQNVTKDIVRHEKELKNANIYLISNESFPVIKQFYNYFGLADLKNIFVGKDNNYSFFNSYKPSTTPYIVVYNRKKELVKVYQDETSAKSLISSIQD